MVVELTVEIAALLLAILCYWKAGWCWRASREFTEVHCCEAGFGLAYFFGDAESVVGSGKHSCYRADVVVLLDVFYCAEGVVLSFSSSTTMSYGLLRRACGVVRVLGRRGKWVGWYIDDRCI